MSQFEAHKATKEEKWLSHGAKMVVTLWYTKNYASFTSPSTWGYANVMNRLGGIKGREKKIWIRMNAIKNPISQQQLFMSVLDIRGNGLGLGFQGVKWCPHWFLVEYSWELFLLHNISLSSRLISLIILFRCHPTPDRSTGDRNSTSNTKRSRKCLRLTTHTAPPF